MAEVREVLDEALKLAPDDRASVAVELLESLETAPEEKADLEAAWAAEIERRARRVLEQHGLQPEYHEFAMGHQVTPESMAVVGAFLRSQLAYY